MFIIVHLYKSKSTSQHYTFEGSERHSLQVSLKMKSVAVLIFSICGVLCTAKSVYESRIMNGTNAVDGQFPHQVSLRLSDGQHMCGASILTERFLLTAAHCTEFMGEKPPEAYAVVGSIHLSGGTNILLDKFIPHEQFHFETIRNDIALIRTAEKILFSKIVQPIPLPQQSLLDDGGTHVVVSGWGIYKVNFVFY